jgi:hypothetical protein
VPTLIPIAAAPAIPPPRARFKDLSKISFVVGIGFGGGVVAASVAMAAAVAGCLKLDAQTLHAQRFFSASFPKRLAHNNTFTVLLVANAWHRYRATVVSQQCHVLSTAVLCASSCCCCALYMHDSCFITSPCLAPLGRAFLAQLN